MARVQDVSADLWGRVDELVPAVPDAVTGMCGELSEIGQWVGAASAFLPWGQLGAAIGIVVAGVLAGLAIKVVRIAASFAALGGGAA